MSRHCAPEAELSVLGSIMLSNGSINLIETTPDQFFDPYHGVIFEKMRELSEKGAAIDPVTLATALGADLETVGGHDKLWGLAEASASAVNIEHHARLIEQTALVRRLRKQAEQTAAKLASGDFELDEVESMAMDASEAFAQLAAGTSASGGLTQFRHIAFEALQRVQAAYESPGAITGIETGFGALDSRLAGMQPGTLIIVAGRPAMGKSGLVQNIATNVAKLRIGEGDKAPFRYSVAGFNLEMPNIESGTRVLASEARVDGERMKTGALSGGEIDRLQAATKRLAGCHLYIDETPSVSSAYIRQKCRQLQHDRSIPPLGLVFVDYLQLMKGKANSREQEISQISRDLKELAKELGVPVIALSQLNRECERRQNKRPMLADLRESGAIEQDADVILFVYRDEYYNEDSEDRGLAEVICAKHRSGGIFTAKLKFFKQWVRFDDLMMED